MGKSATASAPVSMRDAVSKASDSHPYAEALKLVHKSTAQRVLADDPIRQPDTDAFARAVKKAGGINATGLLAGINVHRLLEIVYGGVEPSALDCHAVEKACERRVSCEEMRDDLIWFRDGAGEVIGFAEAIDQDKAVLEAAIRNSANAESGGAPDIVRTLFSRKENQAWWVNVALTSWSEPVLAQADSETLNLIESSSNNLLYTIERGVAAANKMMWAAIQSEWAEMSDLGDLTMFVSVVQQYAIELREVASNVEYQLKGRAA